MGLKSDKQVIMMAITYGSRGRGGAAAAQGSLLQQVALLGPVRVKKNPP